MLRRLHPGLDERALQRWNGYYRMERWRIGDLEKAWALCCRMPLDEMLVVRDQMLMGKRHSEGRGGYFPGVQLNLPNLVTQS